MSHAGALPLAVLSPLFVKRIAIFASGSGSNAEAIARYFAQDFAVEVSLILTNNPAAGVVARARQGFGCGQHVPVVVFSRPAWQQTNRITRLLLAQPIDLVVLAGFMWLVPAALVAAFPGRIMNVHPALLPKFGGKGMFGQHVHEAVVAAGETQSGITIHLVNDHYDQGQILFQATCPVLPTDTAAHVAQKIHALEHAHYPRLVSEVLAGLPTLTPRSLPE